MSKITKKIFKGAKHYITSNFGPRTPIITKYGTTSNFHYGVDYGTDLKKVPQYAVESGKVLETGHTTSYGNYVWIEYPRLKVKMCHLHLDKACVKAGQVVDNDTIIGYTGTTGYSTGIHLHLGVYDLSKKCYVDPEEFAKTYQEPSDEITEIKYDSKLKVGDKVILSSNSTFYQGNSKGVKIPDSVKNKEYTVQEISKDSLLLKEIFSWVLAVECTLKENEISKFNHYIVKNGDTLSGIASKLGISDWKELYKNNKNVIGNDPDFIIPGQVLKY